MKKIGDNMFLDLCENSNALSAILFVKTLIDLVKIGVPIILIIMSAVDIAKQVFNTDEKSYQKVVKRMLAAVAVFFVPTIVSLLLDLLGTKNYSVTTCWSNANTETIAVLSAQEKIAQEAEQKARKKENEKAAKEREDLAATREEIRKKNEEKAEEEKNENSSSSGTSITNSILLKENGTDGLVTVIDGVFYKPSSGTSGADGTKGSGPYGYVIFFYNRLKSFVDAAKTQGYTINMSTTNYGAWRPYSVQQYFYNCYVTKSCNNGNLAARPGTSNHGWGIASDLSFGSTAAKYWAHDNASKYGLKFPLCANIRGQCTEDWHIEPAQLKSK